MTLYPDGDKPIRIKTTYKCPLCNYLYHVWHHKGQTLQEAVRLHRIGCQARVDKDGGQICKNLGPVTDQSITLGGCGQGVQKLFSCSKHQFCLPYTSESRARRAKTKVAVCATCPDYDDVPFKNSDLCGNEVKHQIASKMASALDPDQGHIANSTPSESPRAAE